MRWIGALAYVFWTGFAHAQPVIPLTQASVPIVIAGAATTLLVTGAAGQSIYVTSVSVDGTAAGNIQFISGTGATCGTGTANVTGTYSLALSGIMTFGSGSGIVWVVPQGASLCAVSSAAMAGSLSYARF